MGGVAVSTTECRYKGQDSAPARERGEWGDAKAAPLLTESALPGCFALGVLDDDGLHALVVVVAQSAD